MPGKPYSPTENNDAPVSIHANNPLYQRMRALERQMAADFNAYVAYIETLEQRHGERQGNTTNTHNDQTHHSEEPTEINDALEEKEDSSSEENSFSDDDAPYSPSFYSH